MGYLHINNLYKDTRVLMHKRGYALEKIHGTSTNVKFNARSVPLGTSYNPFLTFYSGGETHANFVRLFDYDPLLQKFIELEQNEVTVYGEAYGGKMQKMSATYGPNLYFTAFEVKIGETWLSVPKAHKICDRLGIEFTHYEEGPMTLEFLDAQRDADSVIAIRREMGPGKKREGIVIRPLEECVTNNDCRVMAKHKRHDFEERVTPQKIVDTSKLKVLEEAQAIADEWVTPMRLEHVLDKVPKPHKIEDTKLVISAMISDVEREAAGEIVPSKAAYTAIGKKTAQLYRDRLQNHLREDRETSSDLKEEK